VIRQLSIAMMPGEVPAAFRIIHIRRMRPGGCRADLWRSRPPVHRLIVPRPLSVVSAPSRDAESRRRPWSENGSAILSTPGRGLTSRWTKARAGARGFERTGSSPRLSSFGAETPASRGGSASCEAGPRDPSTSAPRDETKSVKEAAMVLHPARPSTRPGRQPYSGFRRARFSGPARPPSHPLTHIPTTYRTNRETVTPSGRMSATVFLPSGSLTYFWPSSVFSPRNFRTRPSTIFSAISSGLP